MPHVFEFLAKPDEYHPATVTVVFGDEWLLRKLALEQVRNLVLGNADIPYETFDGEGVEWRDVRDELSTVSLFGAGKPRLAIVQSADKFITNYRAELEAYSAKPAARSILVLVPDSFASNTRLYKSVQSEHLAIDCRAPEIARGKNKVVDHKLILRWLGENARARHATTLPPAAAEMLLELIGPDFGRLDSETEKLAVYVGSEGKITPELVRDLVGGWRAKTIWELTDAVLEGDANHAIEQLDQLLHAGEEPIALFAQMAWSLRQFAAATRAVERYERSGKRASLRDALVAAGVPHWRPGAIEKAERQLKQVGRVRGAQLYRWLLETDLALKGSHSSPRRGRWALEQLILRLGRR